VERLAGSCDTTLTRTGSLSYSTRAMAFAAGTQSKPALMKLSVSKTGARRSQTVILALGSHVAIGHILACLAQELAFGAGSSRA
jgi:hypothetical protein